MLGGRIDGSAGGVNTLDYSDYSSDAGIYVNLMGGVLENAQGVANIHHVFGGEGDDEIIGNQYNNELTGNGGHDILVGLLGDDILDGGLGDDTLEGGSGDDRLTGGAGSDTISYENDIAGVDIRLTEDEAKDGFGNTDAITGIENITGSNFDDMLTGNEDDNILRGGGGNDFIIAGAGADIIDGGTGTGDTVSYIHDRNGVIVDLTEAEATDGAGDRDQITGIENVIGSDFDDELRGDDAANVLYIGLGNDVLVGRGGADTYRYQIRWNEDADLYEDHWGHNEIVEDGVVENIIDLSGVDVDLIYTVDGDGKVGVVDIENPLAQNPYIPDSAGLLDAPNGISVIGPVG